MGGKVCLKKFFKKCDYFGVYFNFFYKSKQKYHSVTGGIIFLIFILVAIIFISWNVSPFIQRKNISIIYYTAQLSETDSISLNNFTSSIALGVKCASLNNKSEIYDMISMNLEYVIQTKVGGNSSKEKIKVGLEKCRYDHFYNSFNDSFDELGLESHFCPNNLNYPIQGIYTDKNFTYYEFTIKEKTKSEEGQNKLMKTLKEGECQVLIYFVDDAIDIKDFKSPKKSFMNSKFIVLHPDENKKMNLFFKLQKFDSYENFLFDFHETNYYLGFSDIEEYSVFLGLNRFPDKIYNSDTFAKIYLRADLKRNIIQRKYMKFTEFLANMSSMFSTIFLLLYFFVGFLNSFYASNSIMKNIFQLKQISNEGKEDIRKKLIDIRSKTCFFQRNKLNESEENFTNDKKRNKRNSQPFLFFNERQETQEKKEKTKILFSQNFPNTEQSLEFPKKGDSSINCRLFDIKKPKNIQLKIDSKIINKEEFLKVNLKNYDYSFIELITLFFFPCATWKSLKEKSLIFKRARLKLIYELDVLTYLKNLQFLELINLVILEKHESIILNFLSKPSISFGNKHGATEKSERVNYVNKNEINDFYQNVQYLLNKTNKNKQEERICQVINMNLKDLLAS